MYGKKGNAAVMTTLLIGIIVGVISLSIVFTQIRGQTTTTAVSNQAFTATNTSCTRLTTDCVASLTSVDNLSTVLTGSYDLCGSGGDNYGLRTNPEDNNHSTSDINVSYIRESCAPITGGITTTIVGYFAVLMAVVILVFVVGFIR